LITLYCCHQALTALAELPLPVHASPHFHFSQHLQSNEAIFNVKNHDQCAYNQSLHNIVCVGVHPKSTSSSTIYFALSALCEIHIPSTLSSKKKKDKKRQTM